MLASPVLLLAMVVASAPQGPRALAGDTTCPTPSSQGQNKNPRDSVTFSLGGQPVKICYGRPVSRGSVMLGGTVPYGSLWRDAPLTLSTPIQLSVAGLTLLPGTYSIYAVPGETEWAIAFNLSPAPWDTTTWQHEWGRLAVEREWTSQPVDTLTVRVDPAAGGKADAATIVLEWERTRVRIPVALQEGMNDALQHCVRGRYWTDIMGSGFGYPCFPVRDRRPGTRDTSGHDAR